jgi:hypothetical protein
MVSQKSYSVKSKIDAVGTTTEKITGRAGLSLVSRYLTGIGITAILTQRFSFLRKNSKGTPLLSVFHQLLCFFFDGTDFHLTRFDQLKKDSGYAGVIETETKALISSHTVKRFFNSITVVRVWLFRKVLQQLFLWRLHIEKPDLIKIGIDTMVMDNNDADLREGVEPTYKKVKGFQPLQLYWGRYLIDAIFRNGKAHSNHGNHVQRAVTNVVNLIRTGYRKDVPIILLADAGFFDENLFHLAERLGIAFIVGGKMYDDIKEFITKSPDDSFFEYKKEHNAWFYCEFGNKRKSWKHFWRTIYAKPITEDDGQILLEYARPEVIIYTNIGMSNEITSSILAVRGNGHEEISPQSIIDAYHFRARDELVNRAFKDFGTEHLPFKRFTSNAAYYYLMAVSFFLFEAFKFDIDTPAIPVTWYAGTFRRRCLDIAGRIIRTGGRIILKIPQAINQTLGFTELWEKSKTVIPIIPLPAG